MIRSQAALVSLAAATMVISASAPMLSIPVAQEASSVPERKRKRRIRMDSYSDRETRRSGGRWLEKVPASPADVERKARADAKRARRAAARAGK